MYEIILITCCIWFRRYSYVCLMRRKQGRHGKRDFICKPLFNLRPRLFKLNYISITITYVILVWFFDITVFISGIYSFFILFLSLLSPFTPRAFPEDVIHLFKGNCHVHRRKRLTSVIFEYLSVSFVFWFARDSVCVRPRADPQQLKMGLPVSHPLELQIVIGFRGQDMF